MMGTIYKHEHPSRVKHRDMAAIPLELMAINAITEDHSGLVNTLYLTLNDLKSKI